MIEWMFWPSLCLLCYGLGYEYGSEMEKLYRMETALRRIGWRLFLMNQELRRIGLRGKEER